MNLYIFLTPTIVPIYYFCSLSAQYADKLK